MKGKPGSKPMHDEHGHSGSHTHGHGPDKGEEAVSGTLKLRKMVEHWISHNEEHARSYRLWATRAREAGHNEPGEILEEIASEIAEQNDKFKKIIHIIDSTDRPD
jgi:hypothetical protein